MIDSNQVDITYTKITEDFIKSELKIDKEDLENLFLEYGESGINRIVLGLTINKLGFDKNE